MHCNVIYVMQRAELLWDGLLNLFSMHFIWFKNVNKWIICFVTVLLYYTSSLHASTVHVQPKFGVK
jgi:hypothetical protein